MAVPSTPTIHTTLQVFQRLAKASLHAAGIILVGLLLVGYCVLSYPMKRCTFSEQLRSDLATGISHSR